MTKPSYRRLIRHHVDRCERELTRFDTDDTLAGSLVDFLLIARHWCDARRHDYEDLDRKAQHFYSLQVDSADQHG